MTRIVIRGGTVLDQTGERRADVAVVDGVVVDGRRPRSTPRTATSCSTPPAASSRPGFVDLHVHLREPGREEAETIETGSRAAALGGFTAVVAMPNTEPAHDSLADGRVRPRAGARAPGCARSSPAGCITIGRAGETLAPLGELAAAGVRLFTDDGNGVQDPALMRRALEYARPLGITLAQHCEVASLTEGRGDARGLVLQPPRPARLAGDRRGADGPPRHRAVPPHRCAGALPAPVDRTQRRARPRREGRRPARHRRGRAAPLHPHRRAAARRSTRCTRSTRRCAPPPTSPRSRPGSPTARSTRSPPTTPRIRPRRRRRRSTRRRPGCSASRPRSRWRSPSSTCRWRTIVAALELEAGGDRRARATATAARSRRASRPTSPCSTRTQEWTVVPAKLASKSRNTPYAGRGPARQGPPHDLRRHRRRRQRPRPTLTAVCCGRKSAPGCRDGTRHCDRVR